MNLRRYVINADLKLDLTQETLNHVLLGDFTNKVFQTDDGRIAKQVISGGLHTYSGWISYLKNNPGFRKVSQYYSGRDEEWYYERELQNGTILLKLPESTLTSGAAKMTMYPENNYKSGYLWKTLFPKHMGDEELLALLDEALTQISIPESREGEIICYYKLDIPLECMRVSVLYRDGKINSFYPTWAQPNTGNNGKPFSFFDNIGHVDSESTRITDDEMINLANVGILSSLDSFTELPGVTPDVFLNRKSFFTCLKDWEKERFESLESFAEECDIEQLAEIYNYINDEGVVKYHDKLSQFAYEKHLARIKLSEEFYNAISVNQNLIEGIYILFSFDQRHHTKFYSLSALNIIKNMSTSPLIDMWAKKRLHYMIAKLSLVYHNNNFPSAYFDCLSTSPSRREAFSEYFYESHDKKYNYTLAKDLNEIGDLFSIISHPPQYRQLTYSNFIHYFSDNLGESYSLHFTDDERVEFLTEAYPGDYYNQYIKDTLKFFTQHIFTRFAHYISAYLELFSKDEVKKPTNIHRIIHEYFKLQVAQRYRINLNYSKYHDIANVVSFPAAKEDVYSVILKHERTVNRFVTDEVIASVKQYLSHVEDLQLSKTLKEIEARDRKETPRFPIPYKLIIDMVKNPEKVPQDTLISMRLI